MDTTARVLVVGAFVQATLFALLVVIAISVRTIDRERLSMRGGAETEASRLMDMWPVALGTFVVLLTALLWITSLVDKTLGAAGAVFGVVLIVAGALI